MPLPDFIIGGERRSGTTSLYHWISPHPGLFLLPNSDFDYFIERDVASSRVWIEGPSRLDWEAEHSLEEYASFFDGAPKGSKVGQKDADLLYWRPAHARLKAFLPDCRFVFVLRNPVERAWSQYWNEYGKGRETETFERAIQLEEHRCERSAWARNHLAYVRRGFYEQSLRSFYEHFPKEQVLVVELESAKREPKSALQEIYNFIGVDSKRGMERAGQRFNENATMVLKPWARSRRMRRVDALYNRLGDGVLRRLVKAPEQRQRARKRVQSVFRSPASSIKLPNSVRADLGQIYRSHVEELQDLLGRKLSWTL